MLWGTVDSREVGVMNDMRRIGIGFSFTVDVSETVIAQEGIDAVRREVRRIYEAAHQRRIEEKVRRKRLLPKEEK